MSTFGNYTNLVVHQKAINNWSNTGHELSGKNIITELTTVPVWKYQLYE